MKKICVFCSSSNNINKVYFKIAEELAYLFVKNKFVLIHGAGKIGLMGILTDIISDNGGKIIGVVPEKIYKKSIVSEKNDELIITQTMYERKLIMRYFADAFITLPGGLGTLEELFEVIALKQIGYHQKPIVVINTNKFFNNLLEHLNYCVQKKFIKNKHKNLFYLASTPVQAIKYLKRYFNK